MPSSNDDKKESKHRHHKSHSRSSKRAQESKSSAHTEPVSPTKVDATAVMPRDGAPQAVQEGANKEASPPPRQPASTLATNGQDLSRTVTGDSEIDLGEQPREFLEQRVAALERQLRIRNADCSRLLQERQTLLPLKQKCASQTEMIEALQDKVAVLEVQRASALETIEQLKKQMRDRVHEERVRGFQEKMDDDGEAFYPSDVPPAQRMTQGPHDHAPASTTSNSSNKVRVTGITSGIPNKQASASATEQRRLAPGGTVVNTAAGPQIIYDSSDISSVGFQSHAKVPYDFLGGPAAQQQYYRTVRQQQQQQGATGTKRTNGDGSAFDEGEAAEVSRVMQMAREEAEMDVKYAEVEAREEQELRARLAALKRK